MPGRELHGAARLAFWPELIFVVLGGWQDCTLVRDGAQQLTGGKAELPAGVRGACNFGSILVGICTMRALAGQCNLLSSFIHSKL